MSKLIFAILVVMVMAKTASSAYDNDSVRRTCEWNVPCGWALYERRPFLHYMRNIFCECEPNADCVYMENKHDMRAYVFYCTTTNDVDMNEKAVYPFPGDAV